MTVPTQERAPSRLAEARRPAASSPEGGRRFMFGVATSDHQGEAFDPRYPDVWDAWEEARGLTRRGRAADFWNRFREDIELARSIGCRAFRFSISWARVEPEPGVWNPEALEHYRDVARAIRAAGMEPIVTVMHWVWPVHVQQRGGLRAPEFPQWFRAYAAHVAEAIGDEVRYWISLNEPNALPFGFIRYWWERDYAMPPGRCEIPTDGQLEAVACVIRNLFRAHTAAREEIRLRNPEARVSANPCVLGFPAWFQQWLDARAINSGTEEQWLERERRCGYQHRECPRKKGPVAAVRGWLKGISDRWRKFKSLGTLANTNWWFLGMAGKLPPFLCPPECVGQLDFVALDYYWGINALRMDRVLEMVGAMHQQYGRAPVWSKGLYRELRKLQRLFPGRDILIAENGCPQRDDGIDRLSYITRHVGEVLRACRHGVPVIGYLCWSLTTCREWGLVEQPSCDFGLFRIDLDNDPELRRIPTPTSRGFRDLVESITRAER